MIAALIARLAGSRDAIGLARYGAVALAVLLLLAALLRPAERAGRLAEWLDHREKVHDAQRRMVEAAADRPRDRGELAQRMHNGRFETPVAGACPPVVQYSREFKARAAEELALLPEGSAVAEMLADYSVIREQARHCG